MLIQVKMMDTAQTNHLSNIMQSNPDVYYATSSEIREKILAARRNLFGPIDISSYGTRCVQDGLETLRKT